MRVHRNVPEDIVKNVRLGNVFERIVAAQPGSGRKLASREHLKKSFARKKTAHWRCAPPGSGPDSIADRVKIRQPIVLQADDLVSFEILLAGVTLHLRAAAANQFRPNSMLLRGVVLILLFDEIGGCSHERFSWHVVPPLALGPAINFIKKQQG